MDLGCLAPASRLKRAQAGKLSRDGKALLGIEIPCTSVSGLSEARWSVVGSGGQGEAAGCTGTHFSLGCYRGCVSSKALFVSK